jgi:hypothetical protein
LVAESMERFLSGAHRSIQPRSPIYFSCSVPATDVF